MKTLIALTAVLITLVGCATQRAESKSYAIVVTLKADIADSGKSVVIPGYGSQQACEAAMTEKTDSMAHGEITGVISARCAVVQS